MSIIAWIVFWFVILVCFAFLTAWLDGRPPFIQRNVPDNAQPDHDDGKRGQQQGKSDEVTLPIPAQPPGGADAARQSDEQDEKKRQKILETSTVVQAWCAVAIAIFGLGQVFVGYWQWDATNNQHAEMIKQNTAIQRQLNQAEKALELTKLDQRPWLAFRRMRLELPIETPDFLYCLAEVENYGKTPGQILKSCLYVRYFKRGTPRGQIVAELDQRSEWVITPDTIPPTGFSFVRPAVYKELTDEDRKLVKAEQLEIWAKASIEYQDTNGIRHHTYRVFAYSTVAESGFFGYGQEMD
jgi:hypothetical protein